MNVIDALRKRRAVKRFDPAFQLSEDNKKQLLQEVLAMHQALLTCSIGVQSLLKMQS